MKAAFSPDLIVAKHDFLRDPSNNYFDFSLIKATSITSAKSAQLGSICFRRPSCVTQGHDAASLSSNGNGSIRAICSC